MKKHLLLLAPLAVATISLVGCKSEKKVDVNVFAAASMTETLTEIKTMYEKKHKNVNLVYNFESSGTLKTQIENGATCDLFISAAQKQMNGLQDKDLINVDTRLDLLENKVALAVGEGNPKNVTNFQNLADRLAAKEADFILGMGNEDVPVGQYTQKILAYYSLNEAELAAAGMISYGSNVKAVTSQVANGGVACGVIYQTDAFSANLTVVDTAKKEMCGQVIYPAAILKNTTVFDQTNEFLSYLQSDEAMEVFESVGFSKYVKA